jgi:hypothetical protein
MKSVFRKGFLFCFQSKAIHKKSLESLCRKTPYLVPGTYRDLLIFLDGMTWY